jgi:hypothetical protein
MDWFGKRIDGTIKATDINDKSYNYGVCHR